MSEGPWEDFKSGGTTAAVEEAGPWSSFQGKPWEQFAAAPEEEKTPAPAPELGNSGREQPVTELVRPGWRAIPDTINLMMEGVGRAGVGLMNFLGSTHTLGLAKKTPAMEAIDAANRKEFGKPMMNLAEPLTPEEMEQMPAPVAGTYNAIAKAANSLTTPEMIMASPLFSTRLAKPLALAFGAQMGANAPEAWMRIGDETLTPAEKWEAGAGAAIQTGMAGLSLAGGLRTETPARTAAEKPIEGASQTEFGINTPVPEKAETVAAQMKWLEEGKRKAVLITEGEEAPKDYPPHMEAHPTAAGVFIFDPKQTTPAEIDKAVAEDRIGEILGYGIAGKPAGAETAVVVRSAEGTEKQAVVTDQANAAKVIEAAQKVADPGDVIGLEPAAEVIAKREPPSRILQKAAREMADARQPVPKSIVDQFPEGTFALPEGYELQGDQYVFKAPAEKLTPEQIAARENAQAMEELRRQKAEAAAAAAASGEPDWTVPAEPTERPEAGTPMPVYGERPPDLLDWIESNYAGVKVTNPEDYGTYVDEATGRSKKVVSKTKGEPADKVIEEMHAQGLYRRIQSEDDLLEAMNRAAEARKAWNRKGMAAGSDMMLAEGVDAKVGLGVGLQYGLRPAEAAKALREGEQYELGLYPSEATAADVGQPGSKSALARRREREQETRAALGTLEPGALQKALSRKSRRVSSIDPKRAPTAIPQFNVQGYTVRDSSDFARLLQPLRSPYSESLKVAILDKQGKVVHSQVLYAGTLDTTVIDVQDIQRLMTKHGDQGKRLMISHNHPSGDPTPSDADIRFTRKLQDYAQAAGFEVVDHVITNGDRYFSFKTHLVEPLAGAGLQPWEMMPRNELKPVHGSDDFRTLVEGLRQSVQNVAHVIYLNTRNLVTAIERVDPIPQTIWEAIRDGYGREGAKHVMVDYGPDMPTDIASLSARETNRKLEVTHVKLLDFAAQGTWSGRERGWLWEEGPQYGGAGLQEGADVLREEFERRQTGEKIEASTAISDPVKQAITEYLYRVRNNATDEAIAAEIVQRMGLDAAEQTVKDPPIGMAQATVSKLLGEVTRTLARQEQQLRTAGDTARAEALAQRQAKLWDAMLPKITELAQGLQALTDIVDMSPDAQVARLKNRIERVGNEQVARRRPELEQLQGAIEAGRKTGMEALRKDPEVNGAARKAVDEALAKSPEVENAIVMELAGPWSESPAIVEHARRLARSRVDEMMNQERVPAPRRAEYLRQTLGDIAKRAATIFAGHLQGAEPGKGIVEKFQERLGLTKGKAEEMAAAFQKEWDAQLKAARAKLPKRIAAARATRERNEGATLNSPTAAVDARIRRELDALNVKLGEVLRGEAERRESTGKHVAERVVQASGLEGEAADTLRTVLENRWNTIVSEGQRRALEQLERASGIGTSRPMKGAFERLVELDRLGALTGDRFYDVVKKALKLKTLTAADAAALRTAVRKAQALPEGYLRQQAAGEVLKLTERLSGNLKWWDVPMGIFYANILSGLTTPAKIVLENMNLLTSGTVAALLARPRELMHPADLVRDLAKAYGRGIAKGAAQATGTLRSGVVAGVWPEPKVPTILELKPFGERLEPLNFWKWFTRVIGTAHETTFKPAWEVKQTLMAREVARREGLSGKELDRRVADLMADTEERVTAARSQAVQDLQAAGQLDRMNLVRRTGEILEQQREKNMPGSTEAARDFALRTAYLNEPYGLLGEIAKGIRSTLETARQKYPVLGMGVKTQVPFTTVVANILNEKLNWTPAGLARAAISHKTGELYGRPVLPGERPELYAKAILGTIALGVMGELFGQHIHGNGPSDPNHRKQLQAAGWVPHSIEIGGRYFSYMNTPAGLGLAVIGNMLDWNRYGKGEEADGVNRLAFAAKATINAIISQGILDSLKRLFEAVGSESTSEGADKLQRLTARTASSFVFPNLLQQVDRIFDPTKYEQTGMEALVKSQVPFVRRGNKPALTVLGEPAQAGPFEYWAGKVVDDPLLRTLAEKQAWVPTPSRNQVIGDRRKGPDHFRAMTPDEYYDFIAISGPEIRRRLTEDLDKIADMDPDQARKYVAQIAEQEHAKAKRSFE